MTMNKLYPVAPNMKIMSPTPPSTKSRALSAPAIAQGGPVISGAHQRARQRLAELTAPPADKRVLRTKPRPEGTRTHRPASAPAAPLHGTRTPSDDVLLMAVQAAAEQFCKAPIDLAWDAQLWLDNVLGEAATDPDGRQRIKFVPELGKDLDALADAAAHEIGHHVLKHTTPRLTPAPVGKRAEAMGSLSPLLRSVYDQHEREAEAWAAANGVYVKAIMLAYIHTWQRLQQGGW